MSSHREAPEISKDPVADSSDLYAFVSPDQPDTVTLIANYVPLQRPAGGSDVFEFGDDVLYEIHVDSNGDARRLPPAEDKRFAEFVETPELAALLPVLYPGLFDNLAELNKAGTPRADLLAILLTGIPDGLIEGFQNNTGEVQADMLRLNTAIPPAREPTRFGLLGADLAGFPNGRRVGDDVVSISLRAIAGATVPLVDEAFEPDEAAALVEQGLSIRDSADRRLEEFPYLGVPFDGSGNPR